MKNNEGIVLKNVLIPGGRSADITIIDGIVSHIGAAASGYSKINCTEKIVLPGAIDMHVHMRDGLQSDKETWTSGTMSALAGGVTLVVDQPNTIPPLTTPSLIQDRVETADQKAYCAYAINGAVTSDADLFGMWNSGALSFGETFAGVSSYGEAVDADTLSDAMRTIHSFEGLMTIHAESPRPGSDNNLKEHDQTRPAKLEEKAVSEVLLLNISRCRLHFCHLSTASALLKVTSGSKEVTPHHLFLSYERFIPEDGYGKVNPPLRSEKERKELFCCWKMIDVIASDHAPHTKIQKEGEFSSAPSGLPGVETMIPLLLAHARSGDLSIYDIIQKTSLNPAKILGIKPPGFELGMRGDFAIYPKEPMKIDPDSLHSKVGWTPYEGMNGIFPEKVIVKGIMAFDNGSFRRVPEWVPGRGFIKTEHK